MNRRQQAVQELVQQMTKVRKQMHLGEVGQNHSGH